jgi:hypothetical protein
MAGRFCPASPMTKFSGHASPAFRTEEGGGAASGLPLPPGRAGPSSIGGEHDETREEKHMDMRKYVGEMFIKVDDVRDGPLRMQIAAIKEGQFEKPDMVFESGEVLSLNATNTRILMRAYGQDSADWVGKEVELALGQIPFQGQLRDSVVVKPISPSVAGKGGETTGELDDQIPF